MLLEGIISFFRSWLKSVCVLVVTILLITCLPLLTVLVLPIYLFRFLLVKLSKCCRPDLGKILTARSATFATDDLFGKPKANLIVAVVLDGNKTVEDFRKDFIRDTLQAKNYAGELANPEFQQCITTWMGFPFWKWDNSFNIENHLKEYDGKRQIPILTKDILNELCTEYLKTPFPRDRSPWEITIFPHCDFESIDANNNNTTVCAVFKLHHSLADGLATLKIFVSPTSGNEISIAKPKKFKRSAFQKLLFNFVFALRAPFELISSMVDAFDVNGLHISEERLSENVFLAFSDQIPTSRIKKIKDDLDVSFTAVLLACFAGAVRRFALENNIKLPNAIHAVMPGQVGGHSEKLRNIMSVCFVRLPIALSSAEMRVKEIDRSLRQLKKSTQPIAMFYLLPIIGGLPSCMAKLFFRQICPTALISNFPGPNEQAIVAGLPLNDLMFTAGLLPGNIGIGFNAVTYNGNLRIQAAFNESLGPGKSRQNLMDKVLQELNTLAAGNII